MDNCADYIISLIGTNPLPAFISILKYSGKNTKIILVHTPHLYDSVIGTEKVAENLAKVLKEKNKDFNISFYSCDKSDPKKINNSLNEIIDKIENDVSINNTYQNKKKLVLDYTSGTKPMSAIFYSKIYNLDNENIETYVSYVDDNNEEILISSKMEGFKRFLVRDVFLNYDIHIEDITKIHGYDLKNHNLKLKIFNSGTKLLKTENNERIELINDNGRKIYIDAIALSNGKLIVFYTSKIEKSGKNEYKYELFALKDVARKLGGDRSRIVYQSNCAESIRKILLKDIKRDYEYDIDKRAKLIGMDETFEDFILKEIFKEGGE